MALKGIKTKNESKETVSGIVMPQIGLETQMVLIVLLTVFDTILFGIYLKGSGKLVQKK